MSHCWGLNPLDRILEPFRSSMPRARSCAEMPRSSSCGDMMVLSRDKPTTKTHHRQQSGNDKNSTQFKRELHKASLLQDMCETAANMLIASNYCVTVLSRADREKAMNKATQSVRVSKWFLCRGCIMYCQKGMGADSRVCGLGACTSLSGPFRQVPPTLCPICGCQGCHGTHEAVRTSCYYRECGYFCRSRTRWPDQRHFTLYHSQHGGENWSSESSMLI